MPERHLPACLCGDADFRIAREILAEINHGFPIGCGHQAAGKALLFHNRNALGRSQLFKPELPALHAMPALDVFQPGITDFTLLEIIFADRPRLRSFPAFIRAHDDFPVRLKLTEQRKVRSVVIAQAVNADTAPVPAVAEDHGQFVVPGAQQVCHIIALHRQSPAVIAGSGCEHKIAHAFSVQKSGVQTVAGDVQTGLFRSGRAETPAKVRSRLLFFGIMRQFRINPLRLPLCGHPLFHPQNLPFSHSALTSRLFTGSLSIQLLWLSSTTP